MPGHGALFGLLKVRIFFFLMVGDTCNQCHRPHNIHTLLMQQLYINVVNCL